MSEAIATPNITMHIKTREEIQIKDAEIDSRLNRAFADGVLFDLHIGKQAWTISPSPEDFGLKEFPGIFKPGRMLMLPASAFETIDRLESRTRTYLNKQSFRFGENSRASFRFVRLKHAADVYEELRAKGREFFAAVEELLAKLPDAMAEMRELYLKHWDRLKEMYPDSVEVQTNYLKREEHWQRLAGFYPTEQQARSKYRFQYKMLKMTFPDQLESASFREIVREHEHDKAYLERVQLMEQEIKQKIEREVTAFIENTIRDTRGEIVKVFQEMLTKTSEAKPLNKDNVAKLKEVMQHAREMTKGFLDDPAFFQQLDRMEAQLENKIEFKSGDVALQALSALFSESITSITSTTDTAVLEISESYFSRKINLD